MPEINSEICAEFAKYVLHIIDGSANSFTKLDEDQLEAIEQRANLLINFAERLSHATSNTSANRALKELEAFADSTANSANKVYKYKKTSAEFKALYRLAYIANYLMHEANFCNYSAILDQFSSYCVYLSNSTLAERRAIYSAINFWGELPAQQRCLDVFVTKHTFLLPGICTELSKIVPLSELTDLYYSSLFEAEQFRAYILTNWPDVLKYDKARQQLEELCQA